VGEWQRRMYLRILWRRTHFVWECELIENLLVTIGSFRGMLPDHLFSRPKVGGDFLVRSTYKVIEELLVLEGSLNSLDK